MITSCALGKVKPKCLLLLLLAVVAGLSLWLPCSVHHKTAQVDGWEFLLLVHHLHEDS